MTSLWPSTVIRSKQQMTCYSSIINQSGYKKDTAHTGYTKPYEVIKLFHEDSVFYLITLYAEKRGFSTHDAPV